MRDSFFANGTKSYPQIFSFLESNPYPISGDIKFWDITMSTDSVASVTCRDTISDSTHNSEYQEILGVSCASAGKFAYITHEVKHSPHDGADHRYMLYVKEKESSGELQWTTDTQIQVRPFVKNIFHVLAHIFPINVWKFVILSFRSQP